MDLTLIDRAAARAAQDLAVEMFEEHVGYQLRDASLEDVEHFFVYTADAYAAYYLGAPDGDDGVPLARAA